MKTRQNGWVFRYVFLILLVSTVVGQGASAAEKEIKIGVIGGFTGMGYLTMKPYFDGVTLAAKEVNAGGGILGRQIELISRDDELKVDIGVREMKDLILRKKVDAVIGGLSSGVILAQSEVAKQYKTPFIVGMGNSQQITENKGHRYIFQLVPNTRMEGSALAVYMAQQGYKTIWTVAPDYEWGRTLISLALAKLKQLAPDVKIVGESWPKLGETDFSPYITSIIAAKPDFVFSILWGADLINFTKQAKGYGLYEKMAASGLYDLNQLRAMGAEMVEGVVGFNRGEFFTVDTPEMKTFVDKFRKAFGGDYPTVYSIFGYESIYNLKQAMEKAKSTNKEKVVDALEGMEFMGPLGKRFFRACDHMANGSVYVGQATKKGEYPFYVYKNVLAVPAEQTWLSCEEIKKLRGGK
jgi:branched-chain amino acid transport system substrate-binding protein